MVVVAVVLPRAAAGRPAGERRGPPAPGPEPAADSLRGGPPFVLRDHFLPAEEHALLVERTLAARDAFVAATPASARPGPPERTFELRNYPLPAE